VQGVSPRWILTFYETIKDQRFLAPDLFMIAFPGSDVNYGGVNGIEERGEDFFLPKKNCSLSARYEIIITGKRH